MENKEIYVEKFFSAYKIFWSLVYTLMAVGGVQIARYGSELVFGFDLLNPQFASAQVQKVR